MFRSAQSLLKVGQQLRCTVLQSSVRNMSVEGVRGFKEKEKTIEDMFFTAEDQRALNKLLNKVKTQAARSDTEATAQVRAAEESALRAIVGKYNVSNEDVNKLLEWKHTPY